MMNTHFFAGLIVGGFFGMIITAMTLQVVGPYIEQLAMRIRRRQLEKQYAEYAAKQEVAPF